MWAPKKTCGDVEQCTAANNRHVVSTTSLFGTQNGVLLSTSPQVFFHDHMVQGGGSLLRAKNKHKRWCYLSYCRTFFVYAHSTAVYCIRWAKARTRRVCRSPTYTPKFKIVVSAVCRTYFHFSDKLRYYCDWKYTELYLADCTVWCQKGQLPRRYSSRFIIVRMHPELTDIQSKHANTIKPTAIQHADERTLSSLYNWFAYPTALLSLTPGCG